MAAAEGTVYALVIGAGQAGLAAGYHLRRAGLSFEILEAADKPGGSWPGYYEGLTLFSPSRYSALPGMPFPGPPERYPTRDEVTAYLRRYAEAFGLPVLSGERVRRAERPAERTGAGFRVLTVAGGEHRARTLISATGSLLKSASSEHLVAAVRAAVLDPKSKNVVVGMPQEMLEGTQEGTDSVLTARELEILLLAARGLSNTQIASSLHLSEATVKRHLASIYPKMGVSSRGEGEASREALLREWITIEEVTAEEEG